MEANSQRHALQQPYTILRIKRKRTGEPLDALGKFAEQRLSGVGVLIFAFAVVDSRIRRKKLRPGVKVFQFAETVEQDAWTDESRTKDLKVRVSF